MTEEGGSYKQGIYLNRNVTLIGDVCLGNPRISFTFHFKLRASALYGNYLAKIIIAFILGSI